MSPLKGWGRAQPRQLPHPYHDGYPTLHWSKVRGDEGLSSQPQASWALTAPALCPALEARRAAGAPPCWGVPRSSTGTQKWPNLPAPSPPARSSQQPRDAGRAPSAWGEGQNTEGLRGAHSRAGNCMAVRTFRPHCPQPQNNPQGDGHSVELGVKPPTPPHPAPASTDQGPQPSQLASLGPASASLTGSHHVGL